MREFKVGDIVQHFKRELVDTKLVPTAYLYEIIAFATHSETGEKYVVYKALYHNDNVEVGHVCVRPYDMFMSPVDREKYPQIKQLFRFEIFSRSAE